MEQHYLSRRVSMDTFNRNYYNSDIGKFCDKKNKQIQSYKIGLIINWIWTWIVTLDVQAEAITSQSKIYKYFCAKFNRHLDNCLGFSKTGHNHRWHITNFSTSLVINYRSSILNIINVCIIFIRLFFSVSSVYLRHAPKKEETKAVRLNY